MKKDMKPTTITLSIIVASVAGIAISHVLSHYRMFTASLVCDGLVLALLGAFCIMQAEADQKKKEETCK